MKAFPVTVGSVAFVYASLGFWAAFTVGGVIALASGATTVGIFFALVGLPLVAISIWRLRLMLRVRRTAAVEAQQQATPNGHVLIAFSGDVEKKDKK